MSKLMDHLNNLNTLRKKEGAIVIPETAEPQGQTRGSKERKGVYFIGFFIIILTVFSALSMSAGLKTLAQLERTEAASADILQMLQDQKNETEALKGHVTQRNSEALAKVDELQTQLSKQLTRISELQDQVKDLESVIQKSQGDVVAMTAAFKAFKSSIQDSMDDLKKADRTMLKTYTLLDEKIRQLNDRVYLPESSSEGDGEIINHP